MLPPVFVLLAPLNNIFFLYESNRISLSVCVSVYRNSSFLQWILFYAWRRFINILGKGQSSVFFYVALVTLECFTHNFFFVKTAILEVPRTIQIKRESTRNVLVEEVTTIAYVNCFKMAKTLHHNSWKSLNFNWFGKWKKTCPKLLKLYLETVCNLPPQPPPPREGVEASLPSVPVGVDESRAPREVVDWPWNLCLKNKFNIKKRKGALLKMINDHE